MNQEQAKQFLSLIQAIADGKTIQFKSKIVPNTWYDNFNQPSIEDLIMYE